MNASPVELHDLAPVPLAVLRQQVRAADLSRVVPDYCGRVWKTLRAQSAQAGRNVAVYWDGAIRLEAGVEALGPFTEEDGVVRSVHRAGAWRSSHIWVRTTAWGKRMLQCVNGPRHAVTRSQAPTGRSTGTGKMLGIRIRL